MKSMSTKTSLAETMTQTPGHRAAQWRHVQIPIHCVYPMLQAVRMSRSRQHLTITKHLIGQGQGRLVQYHQVGPARPHRLLDQIDQFKMTRGGWWCPQQNGDIHIRVTGGPTRGQGPKQVGRYDI